MSVLPTTHPSNDGKHMHRRVLAAVAATVLLFSTTSCGQSKEEKEAIDSLTSKIKSGDDNDNIEIFGKDFPSCFAEKLVSGAGVDKLKDDKVLDKDGKAAEDISSIDKVSEETADAFADAEYDCIDFDSVRSYLKDSDEAKDASDDQVDAYVDCLQDIDEEEWKASNKDQAMGKNDSENVTKFGEDSAECQKKLES